MALTKFGFKPERFEDIVARMETRAKEEFGDDLNTSARVFLGMLIRVVALPLSFLWQDLEDVYHSGDRSLATDTALDMHAANLNTTRRPATTAWGYVTFFSDGSKDVHIPEGTICVNTRSGAQYYTVADAFLPNDGVVTVEIIAVESGSIGNANNYEIASLLHPLEGILDIQNNEEITNGEDTETDAALRRRLDVIAGGANSVTARAIEAKLLEVGGVRSAFVDENYYTTVNSYGTPPGAVQAFVIGGEPRDIAQAILAKKAAGIEPYGAESYTLIDNNGTAREIYFSRPAVKVVNVFVEIVTNNTFPTNGQRLINDIIFVAIGGFDQINGVTHDTPLKMGQSIIVSKLLAQIGSVQGVDDVQVLINKDGAYYKNKNVDFLYDELAECNEVHVQVVDLIV